MSGTGKVFGRAAMAARRVTGRRAQAVAGAQKRNAGGAPMMPIDQNKPHLFSRIAGQESEGWEGIMLVTYVASAAVLLIGVGMGPETSIKQWARDEALARDIRESQGKAVEYGKIYSQDQPQFFYEEEQEEDEDEEEEDEDDDE